MESKSVSNTINIVCAYVHAREIVRILAYMRAYEEEKNKKNICEKH